MSDRPNTGYQPALDGLRAVSVTMVLLFHGGVAWMGGGYVGVSVFFTISGFVITRGLLAEASATGTIALGGFYSRRARRLLPASTLTLLGVVILWRLGFLDGVPSLRRDLLGAVTQTANWVSLFSGDSYTTVLAAAAGRQSPLAHYWSLAIEEQFYWLWPLCMLALVRRSRRRGTLISSVAIITGVSLVAAPMTAVVFGPDAAYWATPARLSEILVGALLAVVLTGAAAPRLHGLLGSRASVLVAPVSFALIAAAACLLPEGSGPAYHGGFAALALVSGALILGLQRSGPVTRALSVGPVVAVGRASYGIYLAHWPVFVVLDESRTGLDGVALLGLRLVVTGVIAALSYHLLEIPVRRSRPSGTRTLTLAALSTVAVVVATLVVVPSAGDLYWSPTVDALPVPTLAPGETLPPLAVESEADPVSGSVVPSRPVRLLVVGDSTAMALTEGLRLWAGDHPDRLVVSMAASPGCGLIRGGEVPSDDGVDFVTPCLEVLDQILPDTVERFEPDVVAYMAYTRDVMPRVWSDDEGVIEPSDPRYTERLLEAYRQFADDLRSRTDAEIVFVRPPDLDPYWVGTVDFGFEPERRAIMDHALATAVAAGGPGTSVLDLKTWMADTGREDDQSLRPDGLHFTPEAAESVCEEWLCPNIIDIATSGGSGSAAG